MLFSDSIQVQALSPRSFFRRAFDSQTLPRFVCLVYEQRERDPGLRTGVSSLLVFSPRIIRTGLNGTNPKSVSELN